MHENAPTPGGPVYRPPSKSEGIGKYVLLGSAGCLVFLAVIGAIFLFVFQSTKEPVKVVNEQLKAVREGDLEKAYSFCSAEFKENTNFNDFQRFVQSFPILKKSQEFSSRDRKISNDMASLKGTIRSSDGASQEAEYRLVKESRNWKVQYIYYSGSGTSAQPTTTTRQRESPQPEQATSPPEQNVPQATEQSDSTGGEKPEITELNVEKQASGDSATIRISFKVVNFKNDTSGGTARIHLVQDLQTSGPDGNVLPDLSREGIKELQESGKYPQYTYANFSNTLSIPSSYPQGNYKATITIHDRIGNSTAVSSVDFQIP